MNIDLSTFAGGSVAERFNQELQKVLENIADPNTDAKKPRKLQLTVTIKSNEKRDIAQVSISAKTTMQPAQPVETSLVMDYDAKGKVVGAELKSGIKGQTYIDEELDIADHTGSKIVSFK